MTERWCHPPWTVCRAVSAEGTSVLLVRADDGTPLPRGFLLPEPAGDAEVDGVRYAVLEPVRGETCWELLGGRGTAPRTALEIAWQTGQALLLLREAGLAPVRFIRCIRWDAERLALDWPEALLDPTEELPQVAGMPVETAQVFALAALAHGLLTGKSPLAPPYVFLPLDRFPCMSQAGLEELLQRAWRAEVTLDEFVLTVHQLSAAERLSGVFAPNVAPGALAKTRAKLSVKPRLAILDGWLLRLICMGLGLYILFRFS